MDPRLLQKQVRDNSEDLRAFLSDLKAWEKDMKRKDKELIDSSSDTQVIPSVRGTVKRVKQNDCQEKSERISSYDYSAWDKFDVDKACAEVDDNIKEEEESVELEKEFGNSISKEQALYEKELGNECVKKQRWTEAIECYSKAIECNPYDAVFYANRALCYLKTNKARFAEADCTSAIRLEASYVKAFQRRGLARVQLGLKDDARADFNKVLELELNNTAAKNELVKLDRCGEVSKKTMEQTLEVKVKADCETEALERCGASTHIPGAGGDAGSSGGSSGGSGEGLMVEPVHRPPHLRSKVPLRKIPVEEVESLEEVPDLLERRKRETTKAAETKHTKTKVLQSKSVTQTDTQGVVEAPHIAIVPVRNSDALTTVINAANNSAEAPSCASGICVPSPPKTSVQFFGSWKTLKADPLLRFHFLKQIPGSEFPLLFRESLESKELSEILSCLASHFVEEKQAVYPYLLGLSQVKRFSALVMFFSKAEKRMVSQLFQHCEKRNECSKEELEKLKTCYEVN